MYATNARAKEVRLLVQKLNADRAEAAGREESRLSEDPQFHITQQCRTAARRTDWSSYLEADIEQVS